MGRWFIALLLLAAPVARAETPKPVDFNRDIRPILSDNCFTCHGPDEKARQANLRLDIKEGAFVSRDGYRILVPGNAAESRLYQRISAEKKPLRMPPPWATTSLTQQQIELIRRWIDEGANWETHWAFVPPKRPDPPAVTLKTWPRNPIDQFILARLESEGLKPSPEAGKITLLRRLSFDLTGLPPTPTEVDAFQADKSPKAYEKQVDRLLNSPRYGERMAMQWLDLARYADTHGYHIDSHRDMWRWRDWVIDAFNRNLPYDRFTIEQLAGDLLPNATREQRIATGFNRNHMINYEGGAIPEEYLSEYVADRVETTSTAWLGLTLNCARCHDHKYDPIQQKDFYRYYAFFNNVAELGLDGQTGNAEPVLELPSAEQDRRLRELNTLICEKEMALPEPEVQARQSEWEKAQAVALPGGPRDGLVVHYELDGSFADTSGHYRHARTVRGDVVYSSGYAGRSAEFSGETHVELNVPGAFDRADKFSLSLWLRYSGIQEMVILGRTDGGRGVELFLEESVPIGDLKRGSRLRFRMAHGAADAIDLRTRDFLVQGDWHHVALAYDGSGTASGSKLYLNGKLHEAEVLHDSLSGPAAVQSPFEIGNKNKGRPYKGRIDDLRIYSRPLTAQEIEILALDAPIRAILLEPVAKRSNEQEETVREYYLSHGAPEEWRSLHAGLKLLYREHEQMQKGVPSVMVMAELDERRETFVLGRGDYRNPGEQVTPGVPAVLPPLPAGAPSNRLGLARWLVDPSHPLTARVAVNRLWQMLFSIGLVKTAENFGSQGEPPSHPELLDWLATEFVRTGWDVKGIQKLIVTSATYRQSSRVTPELLEKDPENRLLTRGPRFRLPAETVRDNALYVSGLLTSEIGGPGVFPYQPKGVWEEIAYGDVYSAQTYTPSHGKDLYRRSMYAFWKRTAPPPALATFDAPDREKCTARRPVTNTPLQALVLMNDATYVETARAMAQRLIKEAGPDAASRIRFAFRLAMGRRPEAREVQVLRRLAETKLAGFRRDPDAAAKLLRVGESAFDEKLDESELAAWTMVSSVVLNLDETITKE